MSQIEAPEIKLNPSPKLEVWQIGKENQAVIIVDNVLADPEVFVDYIAGRPFGAPPAASKYPGLVAEVPRNYLNRLQDALRQPMVQIFNMHPDRHLPSYGFFGLATVPTDTMTPRQAAPHTDAHRLDSYATVHYLSPTDFGGTAFYHHKATGFELITPSRSDKFNHMRRRELDAPEGAPHPAVEDLYVEIAYVEPKFNRLILYRAGQLHSARMDSSAELSDNPKVGRLTANLFFNTEGL